jgi:hypothetical protein
MAEIAVRERQKHLAYLTEILSAEIDDRTGRRRIRRITEARLPRIRGLADFNPDAIPGIAAALAALAAGRWIDAGEPVVLPGDSGTARQLCRTVDQSWEFRSRRMYRRPIPARHDRPQPCVHRHRIEAPCIPLSRQCEPCKFALHRSHTSAK